MELRTIEKSSNIITLSIDGSLDADGSRHTQPHFDKIIADASKQEIEIDLSRVEFLDSSGIGAIVYLYKRLVERQRTMRIENAKGQPLEIISLLRIDKAIPVNVSKH